MTQKRISRYCYAGLILVLAGAMLVGCKSSQSTPVAASNSVGDTYISKMLTTSYTGALNASSQLMLGILRLEGTDNAITSEQAKAMTPVLQSLQGQSLKADAERNAVWANIEAQLTQAQIGAIANLRLTQDDLQTWTRDNSQGPGAGPMPGGAGPQGTPGPGQGGPRPQGTPGAGPGPSGARPPGTPGAPPSFGASTGGVAAGSGQSNVLLNSLIRLLAQKSGAAAPASGSRAATPTPTKP
jgi:hypothetical protein